MPGSRLLIVGGSGFIGHHLVKHAIEEGYRVSVLSLNLPQAERKIPEIEYLAGDVGRIDSLAASLKDRGFDYVVNLGGYINHARFKAGGSEVLDAHFLGTRNLLKLLDWQRLKGFVQIGSSDEYGDQPAPQRESMRESPISSYSFAKAAAGQLLQMLYRSEGFPAVMLRLFLVYGEGQNDQRFLPQIIKGCLQNSQFPTSAGEQLRDFCHVSDICRGILIAMRNGDAHGEIINLASGEAVSIREMIDKVRDLIGKGQPRYGEVAYRKGENMALYADIEKANSLLRWQPKIDLNTGLLRTIDYYRARFADE